MNLVATASDKRVVIDGRGVVISPGGWPEAVAKVEWFGMGGVVTLVDGTAIQFTDDTMLVPLVIAWRVASERERQKRLPWYRKLFSRMAF